MVTRIAPRRAPTDDVDPDRKMINQSNQRPPSRQKSNNPDPRRGAVLLQRVLHLWRAVLSDDVPEHPRLRLCDFRNRNRQVYLAR
jgi:hypothetical protein